MNPGPQTPRTNHFGGLFGVFSDSLPDAWGRLILDRYLGHRNIDPTSLNILAKLSVGGPASFGGLSYRPSQMPHEEKQIDDFDALNEDFRKIIIGEEVEDWDSLYCAAGSSGGSRPKAYIRLDGEDWIIKFPHRNDPDDIGKMEYDYMKAAEECGILIPEVRLLETPKGNKFFAIKRFDREGNRRFHVVSSSSLLERDFSNPTMDYEDLLKLVTIMSKGDKER